MTAATFQRGERVAVAHHDWEVGDQRLPGVVRRMAGDPAGERVIVLLDLGVAVSAHVADVERLDDDTELGDMQFAFAEAAREGRAA